MAYNGKIGQTALPSCFADSRSAASQWTTEGTLQTSFPVERQWQSRSHEAVQFCELTNVIKVERVMRACMIFRRTGQPVPHLKPHKDGRARRNPTQHKPPAYSWNNTSGSWYWSIQPYQ